MAESYDFMNCLYQYNLDCALINEETGKAIGEFKAREYSEITKGSGFVNGGIASGSHEYIIATTDEIIKQADEMSCVIYVEGVKYRIESRKVKLLNVFKGYENSLKRLEYVVILR